MRRFRASLFLAAAGSLAAASPVWADADDVRMTACAQIDDQPVDGGAALSAAGFATVQPGVADQIASAMAPSDILMEQKPRTDARAATADGPTDHTRRILTQAMGSRAGKPPLPMIPAHRSMVAGATSPVIECQDVVTNDPPGWSGETLRPHEPDRNRSGGMVPRRTTTDVPPGAEVPVWSLDAARFAALLGRDAHCAMGCAAPGEGRKMSNKLHRVALPAPIRGDAR